jgi:hypothetical protein
MSATQRLMQVVPVRLRSPTALINRPILFSGYVEGHRAGEALARIDLSKIDTHELAELAV